MNIVDTLTTAVQDAAKGAAIGAAAGPIGAAAGGLGGLVLDITPELGRWLFGSGGEKTAGLVAGAIEQVTGTSDAQAAQKVLAKDPDTVTQLRVELLAIAAQQQAEVDRAAEAQRAADLAAEQAAALDRAGARGQMVALSQARSALAWAPAMLSGIILLVFGALIYVVMTGTALTANTTPLANVLLGTVAAMATQVANYWLGSSSGSAAKNDQITAMSNAAQTSVPGDLVQRLMHQVNGPAAAGQAG